MRISRVVIVVGAVLLTAGFIAFAIGPRPDPSPDPSVTSGSEIAATGTATDLAVDDPVHDRSFDTSYWEPVGDDNGHLIVISHGFAGDRTSHSSQAEALAGLGYTVIAPTHPDLGGLESGDTELDPLTLRPRHLSLAIDEAEARAGGSFDHVTVVGHSLGAYSALRLAGGDVAIDRLDAHCQDHPRDQVLCTPTARGRLETAAAEQVDATDPRVERIVLMAPAYGPALSTETLGQLSTPIQVIVADGDEEVPSAQTADLIDRLPTEARAQSIDGGHYIFLRSCTAEERAITALADICAETDEIDREAIHTVIITTIDDFAAA